MAAEGDIPHGWELRQSESSGKAYYYNVYTKMSQWEKPIQPAPGQVRWERLRELQPPASPLQTN